MVGLRFAWDSAKARENLRKHGVSFELGRTLFADPHELMLPDADHSAEEERLISIGRAANGKVMLACYTEGEGLIRLISVRNADPWAVLAYQRESDHYA